MSDYPKPALAADVVALSFDGAALSVLLIRRAHEPFQGKWALPGGFVEPDESVDEAARRELEEETGLTGVSVEPVPVGVKLGEPVMAVSVPPRIVML